MGYGSYKAADWAKLKSSRGISKGSDAGELFRGNDFKDKYDPAFINMRESCDSSDSPLSTPIILGFDVTGSMGYLAAEIAKNSLNKTITALYDKQPVTNPHVMCAAFTGPDSTGPLQVTQFEADIRVVEQLLELKVGYGWNLYGYDSLVWYFAAKHTKLDCFEKRGKKGFIFCIGDEVCGGDDDILTKEQIKIIFSDDAENDITARELFDLASEKYDIFHIVTDSCSINDCKESVESWNTFMPGRSAWIHGEDLEYLSEVITSIMQLCAGQDKIKILDQWDKKAMAVVKQALKTISV